MPLGGMDVDLSSKRYELVLRCLSALVLGAGALIITYLGVLPFAGLVMLGAIVMCWEWASLIRKKGVDLVFFIHAFFVVSAIVLSVMTHYGLALLCLFTASLIIGVLTYGTSLVLWSVLGVFYVGLPAISLIWLRQDPDHGWLVILYLYLVVWTVDSAAYFFGRVIGGPKLWPRVSPNKTWAGFFGGAIGGIFVGVIFGIYLRETSLLMLGVVGLFAALFAQLGDLMESASKRIFGIKDSSQLIPGHGGLLDRVDGFVFAAVAAAVFALILGGELPGKSLLIWP